MPEVHALLSASSSKQWLNCPPSARLQENFPNESSVYAEEGPFAHSICEYKVKKYLHERVRRPQSEEFYTEELEQSTDVYYEFVVGVIEEMKRNGCEPLVLVEERVDYSHIAPSGFGTADMLIIGHDAEGRGILHICDYNNGKALTALGATAQEFDAGENIMAELDKYAADDFAAQLEAEIGGGEKGVS